MLLYVGDFLSTDVHGYFIFISICEQFLSACQTKELIKILISWLSSRVIIFNLLEKWHPNSFSNLDEIWFTIDIYHWVDFPIKI